MDYGEYLKFGMDVGAKREIYERLRQLQESNRNLGINPEDWREVDNNWQKVEAQVGFWNSFNGRNYDAYVFLVHPFASSKQNVIMLRRNPQRHIRIGPNK